MHLRGLQVRCRATIQSWRLELFSFRVRARLSVQRLGGDTDLASLRGDRFSLRPRGLGFFVRISAGGPIVKVSACDSD